MSRDKSRRLRPRLGRVRPAVPESVPSGDSSSSSSAVATFSRTFFRLRRRDRKSTDPHAQRTSRHVATRRQIGNRFTCARRVFCVRPPVAVSFDYNIIVVPVEYSRIPNGIFRLNAAAIVFYTEHDGGPRQCGWVARMRVYYDNRRTPTRRQRATTIALPVRV